MHSAFCSLICLPGDEDGEACSLRPGADVQQLRAGLRSRQRTAQCSALSIPGRGHSPQIRYKNRKRGLAHRQSGTHREPLTHGLSVHGSQQGGGRTPGASPLREGRERVGARERTPGFPLPEAKILEEAGLERGAGDPSPAENRARVDLTGC